MQFRHLLTAAVDAARALLCPVPGLGCPVPALSYPAYPSAALTFAPSCGHGMRPDAPPVCADPGTRAPARPGMPGPECAAPRARVRPAYDAYDPGALPGRRARDTWAWRASPRARGALDVYMSVGVQSGPPRAIPHVTRTPDPVQVTDTRPGVPSVDVCHERASRTDAARFPLVNVEARPNNPLTLRNRPVGAPFVPYDRPLSILRITDDTRVEMSGRSLVGAEHFYFVIDTWAYDDGETDVILTCERTHKRASNWIDAFGGYV